MASTINATPTSSGLISSADASGVLALQTGGTTAVTIDGSQNVGIGTSSPSARLSSNISAFGANNNTLGSSIGVVSGSSNPLIGLRWTYANTGIAGNLYTSQIVVDSTNSPNAFEIYATGTTSLIFGNSSTERMRIDSSGNLLVGKTTTGLGTVGCNFYNNGAQIVSNIAGPALYLNKTGANGDQVYFYNATVLCGYIGSTATTTSYNTSSDIRLKIDKGVATDGSVIDNTVIHDFEWIVNKTIDRGVFAQEAYKVKPSAIAKGEDELGENGLPIKPWGVDYSKYVPDLIVYAQQLKKAIQEQQALITDLTTRLVALENK